MGFGAIQERQKVLNIFLKAVNGLGASFLPSCFPFFESFEGFDFILSQIDLSSIGDAIFLVFSFAIVRDVAKLMGPAALDLGLGIDQLTSGLKTGRAIHGDEFEVFANKSPEKESLEETLPGLFGFSFGVFEVDQLAFSEHRDAISDKHPPVDVFAPDPEL